MANVIINDTNLTNIANAIREKNGTSDKYKPNQMAGAILAIQGGGGTGGDVEPVVLTGDCQYACCGKLLEPARQVLDISTQNVTDSNYMFAYSDVTKIPFSINFDKTSQSTMSYMFYQAKRLEEAPMVNNAQPYYLARLFGVCEYLRTIPEDFGSNWDWSNFHDGNAREMNEMFQNCRSLRRVPESLVKNLWGNNTSATYAFYNKGFAGCYALDEVTNIGVHRAALTSNTFNTTFQYCYRIKRVTFETNDDGTPIVVNWKNQTIDLSGVGYGGNWDAHLNAYNAGLKQEHEVKMSATGSTDADNLRIIANYPDDWWTASIVWSRYNRVSAVETINSLPDCSGGSGNTIKFTSGAGSDSKIAGTSMSGLTEEEIAVATAKGWTVTLV